ncbi:hypothetical protein PHYBOEH_008777 [Phytophthora boehmeriae]|uniref:Aminotransferase class V domain-containing protein n=1 Tax=Phytophthora boehmeriae TaxID=109152 RepID=A0A8T1VXV0_9STRA|nr:hypothetical protein PHYBOEH_008777 [Phytophthora boehmeriae]
MAAVASENFLPVDINTEAGSDQVLRHLAGNMIGRKVPFQSPFGFKTQVHADYTAGGKSLECIERFIHDKVMPTFGDVHAMVSVTGLQTASFYEEARHTVARAVNASESKDEVILVNEGTHGAINKFIETLQVNNDRAKRPVVFTCSSSSSPPWHDNPCVDVVQIPETKGGGLDLNQLQRQLECYKDRPLKIGCFDAASSHTGMLADVDQVTILLHQHNALAFWDYDGCAPYVDIDMNPKDPKASKDAIFFTGHKFIGGVESTNVLVVKKTLMKNGERGSADVLGGIRLGLAFELKQRVGSKRIMDLGRQRDRYVRTSLGCNKNIVMLGRNTDDIDQLPIFSLLFRFGDRFLHHNFVNALLCDLFGIQVDCGCLYASPSGRRLLGLTQKDVTALDQAIADGNEIFEPSGSRVSFPYFVDDAEVDYILAALHFVAKHGWKLLPRYELSCRTGVWQHTAQPTDGNYPSIKSLSTIAFSPTTSPTASPRLDPIQDLSAHRLQNLNLAVEIADHCIQKAASTNFIRDEKVASDCEDLRWFVYPVDAVAAFRNFGDKAPFSNHTFGPIQPHHRL